MKLGFMPFDPQTRFQALREMALAAEDAGFASLWLADHFFHRFPDQAAEGFWEVFTFLSGLAAVTSRITLGPLVACTAFRNPSLLAKIADALDEVSNGRFILGLGAGWHQPEFDTFGYPFDHLAGRFAEALQVIVPLLREGQVDFTGKYVQARDAVLIPRGPTPGGPPILIAGKRPRMLQLAARYADAWNTAWHTTPEAVSTRYADMLAACQEVGRDPATLELTVGTEARILSPGESAEANPRVITGTADEVIAAFQGFAAVGVRHLMVMLPDSSPAQIARFAPVVAALADA